MCPQNCKIGHFTSWIGQEQLRNVQTMKKAPARLAKFLASVVEYANARRPFNLRRLSCFTNEGGKNMHDLKFNICEVFRLSRLSRILQCWRSSLQRGWCPRRHIENLLLFAQVVLKTSNVVIPRCRFVDDDTQLTTLKCVLYVQHPDFSIRVQSIFLFVMFAKRSGNIRSLL